MIGISFLISIELIDSMRGGIWSLRGKNDRILCYSLDNDFFNEHLPYERGRVRAYE